jgi:hypothetical protein
MNEANLKNVGSRIGDTSDLPESLVKQLNIAKIGDLEGKVVALIRDKYDGAANVDELMVGLYREYKHVADDRRGFLNKLYRMQKSGLIESIANRKGVYKLPNTLHDLA